MGGVALEGVAIRHGSPHGVLEFLIAAGNAGASLQLVGPERGRQQVGQVVVPHGRHLQVLEESDRVQGTDSRTSALRFILKIWFHPTFLCSDTRKRNSSSSWLLTAAGSREGAQSGGTGGRELVAPGAQTVFRASSLIAFHRD